MLENLIRDRVHFTRVAHTGFHHCICEVCHDHTDRGGFKFDGGEVGYNCFNCGAAGKYTENSGQLSRNFRKILNAFSIQDEDIDKLLGKAFFDKANTESVNISLADVTHKKEKKNYLITPEVELPKGCMRLGSTDKGLEVQERIAIYLMGRKIDIENYPFYFSLDPKLINYVIVPFFRNGKIIYWQGRNYSNPSTKKGRYENCTEPKENIIFNFDELFRGGDAPLFVTEGIFDALPLNGIALLGSKINEAKLEIFKKSKRDLIFVIDKDKNGRFVAEKAIENKWKITFAPQFTDDVNKSIITYGKCWTIFELFKQIPKDVFEAKMLVELYCSN